MQFDIIWILERKMFLKNPFLQPSKEGVCHRSSLAFQHFWVQHSVCGCISSVVLNVGLSSCFLGRLQVAQTTHSRATSVVLPSSDHSTCQNYSVQNCTKLKTVHSSNLHIVKSCTQFKTAQNSKHLIILMLLIVQQKCATLKCVTSTKHCKEFCNNKGHRFYAQFSIFSI